MSPSGVVTLLTLVLAVLLKGAFYTRTGDDLAAFESQVGKALLVFCGLPLLLAVLLAFQDFGVLRAVEAKVRREVTKRKRRSQLRGLSSPDPRRLPVAQSPEAPEGDDAGSPQDEDVKVVDVQDVDPAIAEAAEGGGGGDVGGGDEASAGDVKKGDKAKDGRSVA